MNQPVITNKVSAGMFAGAVATLIVMLLPLAGITVNAQILAPLNIIVYALVQWYVPDAPRQSEQVKLQADYDKLKADFDAMNS